MLNKKAVKTRPRNHAARDERFARMEIEVIKLLYMQPRVAVSEVKKRMGVSGSTLERCMKRMKENGLAFDWDARNKVRVFKSFGKYEVAVKQFKVGGQSEASRRAPKAV